MKPIFSLVILSMLAGGEAFAATADNSTREERNYIVEDRKSVV